MLIDLFHHRKLDGRCLRQQLSDEKHQPLYHRWRQWRLRCRSREKLPLSGECVISHADLRCRDLTATIGRQRRPGAGPAVLQAESVAPPESRRLQLPAWSSILEPAPLSRRAARSPASWRCGTGDAAQLQLAARNADEKGSKSSRPAPGIGHNVSASPGGGKSHLAAPLGFALVENGWRVLFTRTTDLVQRLQIARRELALEAAIAKLDKFHLLILDDLAYVTKDQAETSVLFELISARYERRSLLITANQPFGEWGKIFPEPTTSWCLLLRKSCASYLCSQLNDLRAR
jgi:hypothetical protein